MRLTEERFGKIINTGAHNKVQEFGMYMDSTGTIIRFWNPIIEDYVVIMNPLVDERSIFWDVTNEGIVRREKA